MAINDQEPVFKVNETREIWIASDQQIQANKAQWIKDLQYVTYKRFRSYIGKRLKFLNFFFANGSS